MKKIFTLLFVLGAAVAANAQYGNPQYGNRYPDGRYDSRDVVLNGSDRRPFDNRFTYSFTARERDEQLARINFDFDKRIHMVERDRWMRDWERMGAIRRLQDGRSDAVRSVWERFRSSNNTCNDDRFPRNDRRW